MHFVRPHILAITVVVASALFCRAHISKYC